MDEREVCVLTVEGDRRAEFVGGQAGQGDARGTNVDAQRALRSGSSAGERKDVRFVFNPRAVEKTRAVGGQEGAHRDAARSMGSGGRADGRQRGPVVARGPDERHAVLLDHPLQCFVNAPAVREFRPLAVREIDHVHAQRGTSIELKASERSEGRGND